MNRTSVDSYLQQGCGRCDHYRTPQCKVHLWTDELIALRALLNESGLVEEMKWGSPCYTLNGKNVVMLVSLKDCCALSFFKGAVFEDADGVLESPGPSSRFMRQLKFRSLDEVEAKRPTTVGFVKQAIEIERAGKKVDAPPPSEPVPIELEQRLDEDPLLRRAFEALTPGRRRSYILHISGAKQSSTRQGRVERCVPKIFEGKGFNER